MKLEDMISKIKRLNRCDLENETLVSLISDLDEKIFEDIILTHHPLPEEEFVRYDDPESEDGRELLVGTPYTDVYRFFCDMEIYLTNGENDRYNTAVSGFNSMYQEFANYYNRTHMPVQTARFAY